MEYAVVDIETTGASNKITEVAVFVYDSEKREIVDEFVSLVNPETHIPSFITGLTGISNEMVMDAPRFYEIAKDLHSITKDRVFVAHNVNFDYNVIRSEYKDLGAEFRRKKFCTVRTSRKVFPGLRSYSLGKLCKSLGITIEDRHRAAGDAKATVKLLQLLLDNDTEDHITNALNARSKEATLPPNLERSVYDSLPELTGVYYMHDNDGKVIYVGKAIDIRKRVNSHFLDSTPGKLRMKKEIFDISYTVTGSELLALVLESAEIKNHFPEYNRAQKYTSNAYVLCKFQDQEGVLHLEIAKKKKYMQGAIAAFSNVVKARTFLSQLVNQYKLCSKYCGLQTSSKECFDYQLGICKGICRGKEDIESYNQRVEDALASFVLETGSYVILDKGRHRDERSFLLIEGGQYQGYGFLDTNSAVNDQEGFRDRLITQKHNSDIQHIIQAAIRNKRPEEIIYFDREVGVTG